MGKTYFDGEGRKSERRQREENPEVEEQNNRFEEYSVDALLDKMTTERKEDMDRKGLAPFLKLAEGVNAIRIDPKVKPRVTVNKYGREQVLLRVVSLADKQEYDLALSTQSPMTRELLERMKKKRYDAEIVRAGRDRDNTRYSIKP